MFHKVIPLLRIFDLTKAEEFYVDWLGFRFDWQHRFDPTAPVYWQISKDNLTLHLTEHHGDCTPGAKVFVECDNLRTYHEELITKNYRYNRPGLEQAFWGALTMEVVDPFGNKLLFSESTTDSTDQPV